mmetsp:Transcript_29545/g.57941  ORF Transcript_29545/g.57941 Transcript_29545/m.57941 type:complete len:153 (-) Transcript_29545:554-1012(-)
MRKRMPVFPYYMAHIVTRVAVKFTSPPSSHAHAQGEMRETVSSDQSCCGFFFGVCVRARVCVFLFVCELVCFLVGLNCIPLLLKVSCATLFTNECTCKLVNAAQRKVPPPPTLRSALLLLRQSLRGTVLWRLLRTRGQNAVCVLPGNTHETR